MTTEGVLVNSRASSIDSLNRHVTVRIAYFIRTPGL